jgi:hypothetical protein
MDPAPRIVFGRRAFPAFCLMLLTAPNPKVLDGLPLFTVLKDRVLCFSSLSVLFLLFLLVLFCFCSDVVHFFDSVSHRNAPLAPGLPGFSWYNIPKRGTKYTKLT